MPVFSRSNDRYRGMWRLLPSTINSQSLSNLSSLFSNLHSVFLEPIVEIRASVNISIPSWYKGTPVPMICIMKQSDYVKERLLVSKKRYFFPFIDLILPGIFLLPRPLHALLLFVHVYWGIIGVQMEQMWNSQSDLLLFTTVWVAQITLKHCHGNDLYDCLTIS